MFTHHAGEKEEKSKTIVGEPAGAALNRTPLETVERQNGGSLLKLQTSLGNRYVQRLLDGKRPSANKLAELCGRLRSERPRLIVQPKLRVGPGGDRYEQEADRAALIAVHSDAGPPAAAPMKSSPAPIAGYSIAPEIESRIFRARGNGRPLPRPLRQKMERVFSADFGRVKVHVGETADSLNRSLQARAFTTGQDIFFRRGEYNPDSQSGKALLAHELTHVVQQNDASTFAEQVQRAPNPSGLNTYTDPNIPGATLVQTGDADNTGNTGYHVVETGATFMYNHRIDQYFMNGSEVDPRDLAPVNFAPDVVPEAEPKRKTLALEKKDPLKKRKTTIRREPSQPVLPNPIKKIEDITRFLDEVIEDDSEISTADQLRIHNFINRVSKSRNRVEYARYLELKAEAQYEAGGVIHKELFESEKKPQQGKKRKMKQSPESLSDIFSDEYSEESDEELDIMGLYESSPELFQQAVDHSDYNQVKDVINPRNTNMLAFMDRSIIPSAINSKPNISATPKSKKKLAGRLKRQKRDTLRAQQERVFFGSHLNLESKGKFDDSIEGLKKEIRENKIPAKYVEPLVTRSRRGFTIRNTEGHAEQSLLRSKIWDELKRRLIKRIQNSIGSKDLEDVQDSDDAILVTLLLNRSSCRGCGLALSLALVEFWQELATALEEELNWQEMKEKYGSKVRFLIRFPTVYEFSKEKSSNFANLEEVLQSITSVGWEVAPIQPNIQGGMESYDQLNASLKKIGALPSESDLSFFQSGGSSTKKRPLKNEDEPVSNIKQKVKKHLSPSPKKQKTSKEDELKKADQEFDEMISSNNCLPEALLNRRLTQEEATRLRLNLVEQEQGIGEFLDADQPVVSVIVEQFDIIPNIIIYERGAIWRRFLVLGGGVVRDVTLEADTGVTEDNSIVLERINRNHFIRKHKGGR